MPQPFPVVRLSHVLPMQGQLPPQLARGDRGGRQVLAAAVFLRLGGVIHGDVQVLPSCRQVAVRQKIALDSTCCNIVPFRANSEAEQQGNGRCGDVQVSVQDARTPGCQQASCSSECSRLLLAQ